MKPVASTMSHSDIRRLPPFRGVELQDHAPSGGSAVLEREFGTRTFLSHSWTAHFSCRAGAHPPSSPLEGFSRQAVWIDIGYIAAQRNPTNSRATATTTLPPGFPLACKLPNRRYSRCAALSAMEITALG